MGIFGWLVGWLVGWVVRCHALERHLNFAFAFGGHQMGGGWWVVDGAHMCQGLCPTENGTNSIFLSLIFCVVVLCGL